MRLLLLLLLLAACTPADPPAADDDDSTPEPGELEFRFSFAILADPHVVNEGEHAERLRSCVAWLGEQAVDRTIELVLVVGDIGWSGGLELSRSILDELPMAYVPVLGDNEIQAGDEQQFEAVFGPVYGQLADEFGNFTRGTVEAWNPDHDRTSWFQNAAFDHGGLRFVVLDWNSRRLGGLLSETADLHDFDGGSFPFFAETLDELTDGAGEDVVLASHHPMHIPSFTLDELDQVTEHTHEHADRVFGNFAGHYHVDGHETIEQGGYEVYVTDATWDDEITIRLVEVWGNELGFEYEHELVIL